VPRVLSDAELARTARRALEAAEAPVPAGVGIVLSDDEELRDLNRVHLDRDEPTDVLSFPMLPAASFPSHPGKQARPSSHEDPAWWAAPGSRIGIGDVVISVERAVEQAEQGRGGQTGDVRWTPADELRLLVTHGILHLSGWDHADPVEETAMRQLERRLLG
jgi:probable rRNA maturation factor